MGLEWVRIEKEFLSDERVLQQIRRRRARMVKMNKEANEKIPVHHKKDSRNSVYRNFDAAMWK